MHPWLSGGHPDLTSGALLLCHYTWHRPGLRILCVLIWAVFTFRLLSPCVYVSSRCSSPQESNSRFYTTTQLTLDQPNLKGREIILKPRTVLETLATTHTITSSTFKPYLVYVGLTIAIRRGALVTLPASDGRRLRTHGELRRFARIP